MDVEDDLFAHDYVITSNGSEIVSIHKVWVSWGDAFEIAVADGNDKITVLAVVLVIDPVLDSAKTLHAFLSFIKVLAVR